MTKNSLKNIYIIGAGAVGSFFGAKMTNSDCKVKFIGRGEHLKAMQEDGLKCKSINGDFRIDKLDAVSEINESMPKADFVLFTVKTYDTKSAAQMMKPILKKETIILTIQNGVTNREDLKKEIDKGHVLEGYTNIGIEVESPGTLKHSYKGGIIFGGEDTDAIVKFQEILNKSEIVNTVEDNIKKELWKKFLWNSTFNMLTAAINVTVDALFKDERSSKLVDDLLSEIISIADSEGIELGEEERSQALMTAKAVGSYVTSTLNDVRRHKKLEIDTFTGHLVELAKKNNVEAPINNILYAELKAVEAQINFK